MPSEIAFLEFDPEPTQAEAEVFELYLAKIANKELRRYKNIVQYSALDDGGKQGQSYFTHVLDLVTVAERLRPALGLDSTETQCLFLALTIHDINKIPPYDKGLQGKSASYADAASLENIQAELEKLQVDGFFPEWRDYLRDIKVLAHFHQEATTGKPPTQSELDACKLKSYRLRGPLASLMKAADGADNSHSGNHRDEKETHKRDKLIGHINTASQNNGRQFRFVGHRLAELRGLFTNVIHKVVVDYFRDKYGPEACLDLLYYPEGVNYLLDKTVPLEWNAEALQEVAQRVEQKLAGLQLDELKQFIKARPSGIVVDDAAISSGASVEKIFENVLDVVQNKQYKAEWREQRNSFARNDLQENLAQAENKPELKAQLEKLLEADALVPAKEAALKRGELASAYRKFLEDHRAEQLKALKEDSWTRVYRLFALPQANYPIYSVIDSFRRGYFIARDLAETDLFDMQDLVLQDLALLDEQVTNQVATGNPKKSKAKTAEILQIAMFEQKEAAAGAIVLPEPGYLQEYLKRNLEIWDSQPNLSKPILLEGFGESLRQYANAKRPHEQCCHCGSSFKAEEWMAAQVPTNIGVQSFSNRLEGGSARDPKRKVCPVCRAQFILEKLAWRNHRDKQGAEQLTFYLHLFPYSFFTQPLLQAWWRAIEHLRGEETAAFFLDTNTYFRQLKDMQVDITLPKEIPGYKTKLNGLGLPNLSESISNTPVLPIVAVGKSYGLQFLQVLEKAVVLVQWFECRAILTRSPVPPLNLAHERIDNKPVVLMVEGRPRNLSWLLPETSLYRQDSRPNQTAKPEFLFEKLFDRLRLLHQLADLLYFMGTDTEEVLHDFAAQAADDPLALFYAADRLIEKKLASEKGKSKGSPEQQAIYLSRQIAPLLEALNN